MMSLYLARMVFSWVTVRLPQVYEDYYTIYVVSCSALHGFITPYIHEGV
jgi:hypothetical protein